jgi:hypothetical protein
MAIKISNTTVINDSRELQNIASLDATTISTINAVVPQGDITGVTAGAGLTGGGTSGGVTVSHADTSSQASVDNSGTTVIQDVTLDTYGHVTALGSVALSASSFSLGTGNDVQFDSFGVGTAASGTTGEIRATNNITAFFSDERLKDFKGTIPNALDKINQLNGYYYTSNQTAEKFGYSREKLQVGVSAQEVEKVLPEIVTAAPFDIAKDDDGNEYSLSGENYKTLWYDKLVPLLIEAVKELSMEVEKLKTEISDNGI